MGLIGRILAFTRVLRNGAQISDVKLDPGGGPNRTAEHFAAPGDDSHPLITDYVLAVPMKAGRVSAVGYVDPINPPVSAQGEKRIYSRDASGAPVAEVWLKNNGTVTANNAAVEISIDPDGTAKVANLGGSLTLLPDGTVNINGVVITPAGHVTVPVAVVSPSVVVNGVEAAAHTHAQGNDSAGDTQQNTGPMI